MRTIAIANQKGGVGKTVTAINLADILVRDYHKRVLLVDADAQHNLTDFYVNETPCNNLSGVLTGWCSNYDDFVHETQLDGLDVLPGDDGLMYLDISAISAGKVKQDALQELFSVLAEDEAYDFIIVDCPPAFNAASTAAFVAVDEVVIPLKLDAFSVAGLGNILHQIQGLRSINQRLRVTGILPTMCTGRSAERLDELRRLMRSKGLPVFESSIRRSDRVMDMTYEGEALAKYSPRSGAGIDYRAWVCELMGGDGHG